MYTAGTPSLQFDQSQHPMDRNYTKYGRDFSHTAKGPGAGTHCLIGMYPLSSLLPSLEHDHCICPQVSQLQFTALFNDIRMLADQKPANVGKEEPPHGVVGVCIRL